MTVMKPREVNCWTAGKGKVGSAGFLARERADFPGPPNGAYAPGFRAARRLKTCAMTLAGARATLIQNLKLEQELRRPEQAINHFLRSQHTIPVHFSPDLEWYPICLRRADGAGGRLTMPNHFHP